jgi:hypothetical protein
MLFVDYDLDGWPDLLSVGTRETPNGGSGGVQLFWNGGVGHEYLFTPVSETGDLVRPTSARGVAYADIDGDGDLDILVTQNGGPPVLLRNDQDLGNRYLRVRLIGSRSNRDAIGSHLCLRSPKRAWHRHVMPTHGYMSQSELPVTFGYGSDDVPTELEIQWPLGKVQKVRVRPSDRTLTILEPPKARFADNNRG